MEFEPDWKSKLFNFLLGKKRVMTILDASQLMFRQDFKSSPAFSKISDQILYSLFGANAAAILLSFIAGRTIFSQSPLLSISKIIIDACLVFSSYYSATFYIAESIGTDVQINKAVYLKKFDSDFIHHVNYLAVKYQISESLQFQGIFDSNQMKQWIQQSYLRQIQINDV